MKGDETMPRRDKLGPFGQGIMIGRRLGNCVIQANINEEQNYLGFGCRKVKCGINSNFNTGISKQMLQNQISDLQAQINAFQ